MLQYVRGDYSIDTNKKRLDIRLIHEFLSHSYWAKGISLETVSKSIQNSICFGVYHDEKQVGFGRVITDRATVAYLADVFVIESYRGRGLSKWLMECILRHPDLQDLRSFLLVTKDAHGLYARYGFHPLDDPSKYMKR